MRAGRNVALMSDPEGILERQGPKTYHPDSIVFRDGARVVPIAPGISA